MARKINDLLRFDKDRVWMILDTETNGLNLHSVKPWELSYCLYRGDDLLESHERYPLWDDLEMSGGAAKVSRFNEREYREKGEDPKIILQHFEKYLYDPEIFICGANLIGYDIFVLNNYRRLLGMPSDYSYIERIFDVQNIEKAIELNYNKPEGQSQTAWNFKLKSYRKKGLSVSVKALCKKYSIDYDESKAHGALYDNALVKKILNKQLYLINQ